jgi:chemotaxis family two-component system sensor kinase Cph1
MTANPPFGKADLTNCERELIHLAASIQPQGILLTLAGDDLAIVQASESCATLIGHRPESLLGRSVGALGDDLEARVRALVVGDLTEPVTLRSLVDVRGEPRWFEGILHRIDGRWVVVELEPVDPDLATIPRTDIDGPHLKAELERAIREITAAVTIPALADATAHAFRRITGYDRLMVYRFDGEGHGKIIGEDRDPRLESLLGHQYPASDIPQRARQLYIRNRLRLLGDVHYVPALLVPRALEGAAAGELDMSMCYLRSMSPLHLQYLKNMGVTATLVISIVNNGHLWGLIAAHHYAPRNLSLALRTGCDMLGEVVATRLTAIENYAYAHVALQVHRLEQRLVEATSTDGDWRIALFRNPWNLLRPVEATGAVLSYQGEVQTVGEVPSSPQLRALLEWLETVDHDDVFECASVARANPNLSDLTPTASGVLSVRLSSNSSDFLVWLRKEQLRNETWAGDPAKPVVSDDPLTLSPRRSFAAWTELVRDTALPWSSAEIALARAFGTSLIEIICRVNAVRFLIADQQLTGIRASVAAAKHPMLLVSPEGRLLVASEAFKALFGAITQVPMEVLEVLPHLDRSRHTVQRRLEMRRKDGQAIPVDVRAESVPSRTGAALGYFLLFDDRTEYEHTDSARRKLEQAFGAGRARFHGDDVLSAVQASASLAAMDISDGHPNPTGAEILEEVAASTRRATELYRRMLDLAADSSTEQ